MLQPTRKRLLVKLSLLLAFVSLIGIIWAPNDALVAQPAHDAVNSVSTAPTMPTMPTTAPTATKDGHDGDGDKIEEGLDELLGSPLSGAYCKTAGGVGLTYYSSGTFTMNVTGTLVYAYLYWGGRYPTSSNGDNQVQIAINSGEFLTVKADKDRESKLGQGMTYHTYQSANLVNDERFAGLLSGFFQVAAQGLRSAGLEKDEGYGIGLVVISQDPSCPTGQINLFYGLDSFDANRQAPFGPNSEVLCVQFTSAASARTLAFQAFVGGAEGANALWYYVGSGLPPTELIANQLGAILEGPPVTVEPPLTSNTGDQWDNYTNSVAIPAGATFACFQFASIPPTQLGDPVATNAVWVNFVSCLYATAATPTPTATPTATSTATPTATQTATPTTVPTPSFTLDIDIESANPQPGGAIIYRLEYANTSQVTINNLELRLTIPAYTTANGTQSTAGWNCEGSGPGAVCSFTLGNVAPGAQGAIRFVVTLDANMPLTGESIVLTVRARDADNLIDLEVNSDVIVIGQQGSLYFLPLIR